MSIATDTTHVMHARLTWLFMLIWLLALFCLSGCEAASDSRKVPPFLVEFSPLSTDANLEFDVRILEKKTYRIEINFAFDDSNPEISKRARHVLGVQLSTDKKGPKEPGVPASFEVKVRRSDAGKPFLIDTVARPNSSYRHRGRYVTLALVVLEPSEYKVSVKVLSASAELSTLRTMAGISPINP